MLPIFGEIFLRVINDMVCTNRAHHVHIPGAAHGRDFGPERFGNLHRKRPHTTRRTINQHLLSRLNLSFIAKPCKAVTAARGTAAACSNVTLAGFNANASSLGTDILGKTAPTTLGQVPEYLITWLKLLDVPANRFNPPRYGSSGYGVFWFEKPEPHRRIRNGFRSQEMQVRRIDGCRMNFYQDFIVFGSRFFYLFELKHIR